MQAAATHRLRNILGLIVLLAGSTAVLESNAEQRVLELPQLVGTWLGDFPGQHPPANLTVDLGTEYAHIDSAALRLSGTLSPGLYGDLNFPGEFPLSVNIFAWVPGLESTLSTFVETILPAKEGPFEFDGSFRGRWNADGPNFSPWLEGTAGFNFDLGTPFFIGTTVFLEMPEITIDSASLVITGQPHVDAFSIVGDFNGDGVVDGDDLTVWKNGFGNGREMDGSDFLAWQRHVDAGVAGSATAQVVPEPASLAGWLLALLLALRARFVAE